MRPIQRLAQRKDASFGGDGDFDGNFGPFWSNPNLRWWPSTPGEKEKIESSFEGYVRDAYKRNGIVFACEMARAMPFSEVVFAMQDRIDGRWGKLHGDPSLSILERPWTNGTTGELLIRMEQDASLAGNFYATPVNGRVRRMRPDYVTILSGVRGDPTGSPLDLEAEILLYVYEAPGRKKVLLTPANVVHYSPIPDPEAQWRGMSWLTPLLREIVADTLATKHKLKFFENGATLGMVISYDKELDPEELGQYVEMFKQSHVGTDNAYKALHIGGGADATVVGADLRQLDFKATQGAGETRIAAAAGVGAIMARLSEGMQGSALNQGNYNAARRQFADMTIRPLWRTAAASLEKLTKPATDQRLWYDARDVEFLKEDRKDAAEIQQAIAVTMKTLVDSGWTAESVLAAVESGDNSLLVHSGLYSVQLQAPGSKLLPDGTDPSTSTVLAEKARKLLAEVQALKVGARNSSSDQQLIQTAHDALAGVGAVCSTDSPDD